MILSDLKEGMLVFANLKFSPGKDKPEPDILGSYFLVTEIKVIPAYQGRGGMDDSYPSYSKYTIAHILLASPSTFINSTPVTYTVSENDHRVRLEIGSLEGMFTKVVVWKPCTKLEVEQLKKELFVSKKESVLKAIKDKITPEQYAFIESGLK